MKRILLSLTVLLTAGLAAAQAPYEGRALGRKFSGSIEVGGGTCFELTGRLHTKINDYLTWDLGVGYRYDYTTHDSPRLYGSWGYRDDHSQGVKLTTGLRAFTPAFAKNKAVRGFLAYDIGYLGDTRERDYFAYGHYQTFGDFEWLNHAACDVTVGFEFWHRITLGYGLGLTSCKGCHAYDVEHTARLAVCF